MSYGDYQERPSANPLLVAVILVALFTAAGVVGLVTLWPGPGVAPPSVEDVGPPGVVPPGKVATARPAGGPRHPERAAPGPTA
jgi:hypothetical protein